jgi:hypothetical protein
VNASTRETHQGSKALEKPGDLWLLFAMRVRLAPPLLLLCLLYLREIRQRHDYVIARSHGAVTMDLGVRFLLFPRTWLSLHLA